MCDLSHFFAPFFSLHRPAPSKFHARARRLASENTHKEFLSALLNFSSQRTGSWHSRRFSNSTVFERARCSGQRQATIVLQRLRRFIVHGFIASLPPQRTLEFASPFVLCARRRHGIAGHMMQRPSSLCRRTSASVRVRCAPCCPPNSDAL